MKKIISLLLAMIMVFSLATEAFADETTGDNTQQPATPVDTSEWKSESKVVDLALNKIYTVTGQVGGTTVIVPDETLSFVSTAAAANPTTANLTIATLDDGAMTDGDASKSGTMSITLPVYTETGIYNYTITETAGAAQAATYSTESIGIQVLVTYDYENSCLATQIALTTAGNDDNDSLAYPGAENTTKWKLDTFENEYKLGSLDVKKAVTGNLGAKDVQFKMTVKFVSDKDVMSDITITDSNNEEGANSDATVAQDWTKNEETGKYEATATIYVKHDETVTFDNIPQGVTYTVTEDAAHATEDPEKDTPDQGYTISYNGQTGTIAADKSTATVTNNKETSVETGIALDSAPYFLMLAVAMFGMVALVSKKRYEV